MYGIDALSSGRCGKINICLSHATVSRFLPQVHESNARLSRCLAVSGRMDVHCLLPQDRADQQAPGVLLLRQLHQGAYAGLSCAGASLSVLQCCRCHPLTQTGMLPSLAKQCTLAFLFCCDAHTTRALLWSPYPALLKQAVVPPPPYWIMTLVMLVLRLDVQVRGLVVHAQVPGDGVSSPEESGQPLLPYRQLYAGAVPFFWLFVLVMPRCCCCCCCICSCSFCFCRWFVFRSGCVCRCCCVLLVLVVLAVLVVVVSVDGDARRRWSWGGGGCGWFGAVASSYRTHRPDKEYPMATFDGPLGMRWPPFRSRRVRLSYLARDAVCFEQRARDPWFCRRVESRRT